MLFQSDNPAAAQPPPPAVAIFQPGGTCATAGSPNRTTQQQFQQASKRSVLFERASPSWWTVRFDSDILERQHWRSLYSHSKRRFRAALAYVLLASLAWLIYFVALQPGAAWLPFAAGCLLVGLTSLAVLVMSYMQLFLRHAWWLPTWYAILLCCTTALMVVFRNDNLSPITVFCTFVNVLLLLYTVFPLSLGTCTGIGIVFTCVIAVLNVIFHDEHLDEHTFVLPTLLKLILMLLVHVVGVALYVSSQARLRSTFLKVAQSILAKHELGQEKTFVERMIHSVMPPNVAQQIMAGQLQDRRLSSNASVLHLQTLDDDDDGGRNKKKKKKSKYHSRRSRGSSCVSSSAAKAAAAMFADPVSQVGGGSPTYGGGGGGGGGHGGAGGGGGGGARGAAGPSIFRPYHMTVMENVSILFADVVGFTAMSSNKTAEQLVNLLNDLFGRFDMLCPKYSCEKISILGDCYYCVSGCPVPRADHAVNCVEMGLVMIDAIGDFCRDRGERVQMRVGVHTGSVLAGIVGHKRFKFDVFSNDVTLANKMESTGHPGKVHISEKTYEALLPEQRQLFVMEDGPRVDTVNTMFVLRKRTVASNKRRYPASAPALDQLEQQQPPTLGGGAYHAPPNDMIENNENFDPADAEERPKSSRKRNANDSVATADAANGKKSSNHSSTDRDNSKTRLTPPRQTMPSFQKPSSSTARTHKVSTSDSTNRAPLDASSSSFNSAGSSNDNEKSASVLSGNATSSSKQLQKQQQRDQQQQQLSHERVGSFKREGSFKANRRPSLRSQLMEAQLVQNATKILATDVSTLSTSELISRRTSKSTSQSPPPTATVAAHFFTTSGGSNSNSTISQSKRDDVKLDRDDSLAVSNGSSDGKTNPSQTKASIQQQYQHHYDLRPSPSRSEGMQNSGGDVNVAAVAVLGTPGSPGGSRLVRKRTSLKGNYSWPGHEEVCIQPDNDDENLAPQQQQELLRQAEYAAAAAAAAHRGSAGDASIAAAAGAGSRRGSRKSGSPLTTNLAAGAAAGNSTAAAGADKSASRGRHNLMTADFRPSLQPMQSISPYSAATTPTDLESQQFARAAAAIGNMPGLQRQYDVLAAGAAAAGAVNMNQQQSPAGGIESGVDTTGRRASPMRAGGGGGGKSAMTAMYEMRRDSVFAGNINDDDDNLDGEGRDSADGLGGTASADSDADDPRDAPRIRYDKLLVRLMKYHSREVGEDYFSNPPLRPISLNFLDDDLEHAYRHNFAGRHVGTWTDNNNQMNAACDDGPGDESQRLWQHEHHYYYEPNNPANNTNTDHSTSYAMTAMDNTKNHHQNGNAQGQQLNPPANSSDERSPSTSTSIYYGGDNVRTFSSNKFNTFIDLLVATVLLTVIIAVCIVVASAAYLSMPFLFIMPLAIALQVIVLLPSAYLIYQPTLTDVRKQSSVTISMDELGNAESDAGGQAEDAQIALTTDSGGVGDVAAAVKKQQLRRERAERRRRRSSNFLQQLSKYFYWNQTWYARHAVGAVLMLLPCAVVWSTFNCEQLCKLMEPCDANIFFCLALFTAFLNFCNFAQLSSWLRTGLAAVVCLVFVLMVSFNICSTFGSTSGGSGGEGNLSFNSAASTVSPTVWSLPSRFNVSNRQLAAAARAASAAAAVARQQQPQQENSAADYNDFSSALRSDYDISNPDIGGSVQKFAAEENAVKSRVKRFLFNLTAMEAATTSPGELSTLVDVTNSKSTARNDIIDESTGTAGMRPELDGYDYADYDADDEDTTIESTKKTRLAVSEHATIRKRVHAPGTRATTTSVDDYNFVSRTSATVRMHIYNSTSSSFITAQQRHDVRDREKDGNEKFFSLLSSAPYAKNSSRRVMHIKDFFTHNDNIVSGVEQRNNDASNSFGTTSKKARREKNKKLASAQPPLLASRVGLTQREQERREKEHEERSRDKSITYLNSKWIVPAPAVVATEAALPTNSSGRVKDDKDDGKKSEKTQWAGALITHAQSAPLAGRSLPPQSSSSLHYQGEEYMNIINSSSSADAYGDDTGFYTRNNSDHRPMQRAAVVTPSKFIIQQTTFEKTAEPGEAGQNNRDFAASLDNDDSTTVNVAALQPETLFPLTDGDLEKQIMKVKIIQIENNFSNPATNESSMPFLLKRAVRQAVDTDRTPPTSVIPVAAKNGENNCLRYFADIIMIDERTLREGRGVVDQEAWYWRLFHHASPVQYEAIFDALLLLILISFLNRESEIIYRLSFHADSLATRDRETILEMKTQADLLLHNIIPQPVVAKLKETNGQYSENMSNAAIIFASVTNFSGLYAEDYAHGREFLRFLNELIGDFDSLLDKPEFKPYVHKIKTIGATYMAAAFPATALANKPSPAPGASGGGSGGGGGASLGIGGAGKRTSQAISLAAGAQYRSQLSQQQQSRASMPGDAPMPIPRVFPSSDATRSVTGSTSSPSRTAQRPSSGTAKSPLQSPVRSPSLMFGDVGGGGGTTPKRGSGDAGGVDESRLHQYALMDFAIALQDTVREFNKSSDHIKFCRLEMTQDMLQYEFKIRIGYNVGEVTAGVLGTQKMYFDIWGDAVNLASRMDSTGVNGEIQVEEGCMIQMQDVYEFRPREGGVYVKGKGEMKTDFLVRKRPKRLAKTVIQATASTASAAPATAASKSVETAPLTASSNFTITNL